MMKVIDFFKWKFRQATLSDWLWWLGCALIGAGAVRIDTDGKFYMIAGFVLWFTIIFFEIIIKGIKRDYERFTEERNNLFETIKNSEK